MGLCRTVSNQVDSAFVGRWRGRELVWNGLPNTPVSLSITLDEDVPPIIYELSCSFPENGPKVQRAEESATWRGRAVHLGGGSVQTSVYTTWYQEERSDYVLTKTIHDALAGVQYYRWAPKNLAAPVAFNMSRIFETDGTGFGLSLLLSDILNYDHERFRQLEQEFCAFFDYVKRIRLRREGGFTSWRDPNPVTAGLGIYFELVANNRLLPAEQASDGMLLVLAYLAILHSPEPPRLLLLEEPENGVHPRRLADVLNILKELVGAQKRTQVILTTHSPYVVDLFQPEEVTLCLKGADGAVTTRRLSESKAIREQLDVFQLGEIWTAEGDEALAAPVAQQ